MEIKRLYEIFKECESVATDSRTIKGGELFFALKGDNFDGNKFALNALEAGASYAVVASEALPDILGGSKTANEEKLIAADDTLETLQELARYHRSVTFVHGRPLVVIGLTGTNGKTTTKELIKAVLSVKYNVTATEGNLNNSIGVPLTLLKINSATEIVVVEMGASHHGDISELCSVSLPDYGIITNVGKAHLLGFGSFEGVMKAKGELYDYMEKNGGRIFLDEDNPYLCRMASEHIDLQIIPYGIRYSGSEILASSSENPYLSMKIHQDDCETLLPTHLVGAYNAGNVMAAIAVGKEFGIPIGTAARAIMDYIPSNSRSQMTDTGKNILILDAYNANPTSMEAALTSFCGIAAKHKIVMLGNMLELGDESEAEHKAVLERLDDMELCSIFLVGPEFGKVLENRTVACDGVRWFENSDMLAEYLEDAAITGTVILIKGSRGSRMEKVIPFL